MAHRLNHLRASIFLIIISCAVSVYAVDNVVFDYFKNSGFQDFSTCPTSSSDIPSSTCGTTNSTCYAQAKNQTSFCSHFANPSSYTLLPTDVTSAAYLESWSSTLLQAAVMVLKYLLASTAIRCVRSRKPYASVATQDMQGLHSPFPPSPFHSPYLHPSSHSNQSTSTFAQSEPQRSSSVLVVEHEANIKTSLAPTRQQVNDIELSKRTWYPFLIYDTLSIAIWWYQTFRGIADPPHAPWLNPSAWLTPAWYWIVAQSLGVRKWALGAALLTLGQLSMTIYTFYYKFRYPTTGAVSYSLISDMISLSGVSAECANIVNDPFNAIYSDPQVKHTKAIQLGLFACTLVTLVVCFKDFFRLDSHQVFVNHMRRRFIIVSVLSMLGSWILIGFTVMFVYAIKGAPFMWNEPCKVVVVALSAKMGYWDVQGETGWRIVKTFFGL